MLRTLSSKYIFRLFLHSFFIIQDKLRKIEGLSEKGKKKKESLGSI